jgi:hypothetical protein
LLDMDYGKESMATYDLFATEKYVNLVGIIPDTSPSTLATVSYDITNNRIRLDSF